MSTLAPHRTSGVVAARGFRAAGGSAGIKGDGALDLALIAAEAPVAAAGVFTRSYAPAPPVELDRRRLESGRAQAVIVNSGIANAGTGPAGREDAEAMGRAVAEQLACSEDDVLVCSTGVIGPRLPVPAITGAVPSLVSSLGTTADHDLASARGIMTTDSVPKRSALTSPGGWTVGGIAKGAGMLRPDMATMLAFLTTDAEVPADLLQEVLAEAVASTFNCLNVDGCQSTNDTVLVLAGGGSGVAPRRHELGEAMRAVCGDLALQMAQDAEGATKVVRIRVSGAADDVAARRLGMQVADSALVRAAFYGADPNWGRILAAVGVAGVPVDQGSVSIAFDGVVVCRDGVAVPHDDASVSALMRGDFTVDVGVGSGPGTGEVVTTDLTPDYVRFNGERS